MLVWDLLAVVGLILVNGALSMSELAVVSSRKSRLERLAENGGRGAAAALRLMEDPSRFFATVQIGITLVGIFAGAFGGATLGERLGAWLSGFPALARSGQALGLGLTVVAITYFSLVIGELLPKRIALAQPERIASLVAGPMRALSIVAAPAVWALHVSTEWVLRLLRLHGVRDTTITEDEIKALIAEGTQGGVFVRQEQEMIEGVLRLADRPVRVIMTPRPDIAWVDVKADRTRLLKVVEESRVSRLLICEGSVDHPIGVAHTKDLLAQALRGSGIDLRQVTTPALFVPDRAPVLRVLNQFKHDKAHIAVVIDEYGSVEGLVTLTDLIEAIAGDLPERGEEEEPRIVRREDGSWLVDGSLPTDEIEANLGIDMGEEVKMLAGFMLDHLGRIPKVGMSFVHRGARLEIVDMDGIRIDKVLIHPVRSGSDTAGPAGE